MRIILFGPPGVGKGTQAKLLSTTFNTIHISTGDILRLAITSGTELGRKAKEFMDTGHLVPDDVMIGIMRDVLKGDASKGFILDGFPRTVPQAEALTLLLEELCMCLQAVVSLEVDQEEIVARLSNRVACSTCGRIYNLGTDTLADPKVCPNCGGELVQREDDNPETIRKRLRVYVKSTEPVKEYYQRTGLLRTVDATESIEQVNRTICSFITHH